MGDREGFDKGIAMAWNWRLVGAGAAAVVVGPVVVAVVEMIGHALYPPPPGGMDLTDKAKMAAYVRALPLGAILFVLAAWLCGSFAASFVGGKIAGQRYWLYALIGGGLIMLATLANMLMIPHPLWLAVSALVGIPLAAVAGMAMAITMGRKQPG